MKKSHFISGLLIIILFACNNNSGKTKQQNTKDITASVELKNSTMKGFKSNIENDVLKNENYREVLYTGQHLQLVLMNLKPGEEIGEEIHVKSDQFFRFESGKGKCIINGNEYEVAGGDVIIVPSGSKHNVINTDAINELKMYTIYALPQHKDGIIRATKKDAENNATKFDGITTE
jgi:mannose-6-phosphate isomerase-like protein (cupin superfamily)